LLETHSAPIASSLLVHGVRSARVLPLAGLAGLLAASTFIRTRALDTPYWMDEGISLGIASQGLLDIPGVLERDGSPPLYYLLLAVWLRIAGSAEEATHLLSLAFALVAVPVGYWAGSSLFGRRAGWACAVIAALHPRLTIYAQEARMYSLVMLLSVIASAAFLHAFAYRARRYVLLFAGALTALLYTHNWGLFFAAGALAAFLDLLWRADDRGLLARDGAVAFGLTALLYLPWLPTFLFQVAHTGAPWSEAPALPDIANARTVASATGLLLLAFVGGIWLLLRGGGPRERSAVRATLALLVATFVVAWIAAQVEPSWANRYLAVLAGPVLLLGGAGVARAGLPGALALVVIAGFWLSFRAPELKSNAAPVAREFGVALEPGDLVVSGWPEQVPVLSHFLPDGLSYATPLGPIADPRVMDWRDALPRLESARPSEKLLPLLDGLPRGARALVVLPIRSETHWDAPWKRLVLVRSRQWEEAFARDTRFRKLSRTRVAPAPAHPRLRATLYEKIDE
jgi:mannosyltransferase